MPTYLVTGGAGFIGSHLAARLVAQGAQVRVLDNLATGAAANLAPIQSAITFIRGDIRDAATVASAMVGVDVVFHQAALASVQRSIHNPWETNEVNVDGTLHVLMAARDAGVRRVVFASSSSVYGNSAALPKHEQMPVEPLSPYAVSKLAGEQYCAAFTQVYGLPTIALRYFNVFGPRQDPHSAYAAVIPLFASAMLRGEAPQINGDGEQSRDFTYIENVVDANLCAADAPSEVSGSFNVAAGARYSLLTLVERMNQILGTAIAPVHGPARLGDVRHSQASIDRIVAALGYTPRVSFDAGLQRTIAYYRDRLE